MSQGWDILRNVSEWVRFSDTKAGVVLAFAGGSAVQIASKADTIHAIIAAHPCDGWGWALFLAVVVYFTALLLTMACAAVSVWPSLGSAEKRSMLYFGHICDDYGHDHGRYAKELAGLDETRMNEELAHQICVNASIAKRKYRWVGRAIRSLFWTIGFWAVTVLIVLILGTPAP